MAKARASKSRSLAARRRAALLSVVFGIIPGLLYFVLALVVNAASAVPRTETTGAMVTISAWITWTVLTVIFVILGLTSARRGYSAARPYAIIGIVLAVVNALLAVFGALFSFVLISFTNN